MARTDYGAILSTVIKDTSDAIREVNGTSSLIAPNGWGSAIRTMHSDSDYDNVIDQLIEETASGSIASFSDGANNLPCEVTCTLNPVQSGSGDPSPSNVRPITGHDDVTITQSGKNLCDLSDCEIGSISNRGVDIESAFRIRTDYMPILPNTQIAYSVEGVSGVTLRVMEIHEYNKNGDWLGYTSLNVASGSRTTSADTYSIRFLVRKPTNEEISLSDVSTLQVEIGSSASTYEPFKLLESTTITFPDTVYGGSLDVETGVLTDKMSVKKKFSDFYWGYNAQYQFFYCGISDIVSSGAGIVCDCYKTISSESGLNDKQIKIRTGGIALMDTSYTDTTTFLNAMGNNEFVYELATPITTQLTPEQLNSILGDNNFYHDGNGEIQVVYKANGELYVQQHS